MVDHADIRIRAEAKGQYGVSVLLCCCAQTQIMHIVGRQYRRAAFDQAFKDLCLGIGNAAFIAALVTTFYTISYALTVSIYHQLADAAPQADFDLFD